jgi:hypothetical protein
MSDLKFDDDRTLFRAVYAGIALHGLIGEGRYTKEEAVEFAVEYADLLLEELENDEPKERLGVAALSKARRKYK